MSSEYDELIMLAERRELESALAKAVRERDAARAKADTYKRDWYEAKSEFGTAAAKLRESVRTLEAALTLETRVSLDYQSQRDEARQERDAAIEHADGRSCMVCDRITVERDEARAERDEAQAALGAAWMTGGVSLAEGIRRKTAALEKLR